MRTGRFVAGLLLGGLVVGFVAGDEFQGVNGCHVTFPGKGRKQTTVEERTLVAALSGPVSILMTSQVQEQDEGLCALTWFDLPLNPELLEAQLKRTQAESASQRGYKLLSEARRDLTVGKDRFPGFELVLEKKQQADEKMRLRTWFNSRGRVFQVVVTGKKAWVDSDEATKFLDSFGF